MMFHSQTDNQACRTNNEQVFSEIYSRYFPKLLRFTQFYSLTQEDAENLVQDMFVDIWGRKGILDGIQNLDAFFHTLIRNRCIDYLRKQLETNRREHPIEDIAGKELEFKLFSLQRMDEGLLSDNMETILQNAINKLPERCREIFMLSRMEGLKNREIADKLQISVSTVENQMTIAIRKLKSDLNKYFPLLLLFYSM